VDIVSRNAAFGAIAIYRIPSFKWDSYAVYTNEPPACAFRGFGSPEVTWGIESHMDMLAEKLDINPVELRRRNILKEGEINVTGEITHSIGARKCLDKIVQLVKVRHKPQEEGPWRKGIGLTLGNKYSIIPTVSIARVKVAEDESIFVYHSADEVGQGCNTMAAQVAAEEFGLPVESIKIVFNDTLYCPYSAGGSTASRVTLGLGNAIRLACQNAKCRLFEIGAERLGTSPGELDTKGGEVFFKEKPRKRTRISELFLGYRADRQGAYGNYTSFGEIIGNGIWQESYTPEDLETGQIDPVLASQGKRLATSYSYVSHGVEVAVNIDTGEVKVLWFGMAGDMGQPVNPKMCEQQMEGGMGMGIGAALYEEMQMNRGSVINPSLTDYRIPSMSEMPLTTNIKSVIASVPHKDGPFGAKGGFGEGTFVGIQAAIGNAIYNAVGVRIQELPITPEKVLKALKDKVSLESH